MNRSQHHRIMFKSLLVPSLQILLFVLPRQHSLLLYLEFNLIVCRTLKRPTSGSLRICVFASRTLAILSTLELCQFFPLLVQFHTRSHAAGIVPSSSSSSLPILYDFPPISALTVLAVPESFHASHSCVHPVLHFEPRISTVVLQSRRRCAISLIDLNCCPDVFQS